MVAIVGGALTGGFFVGMSVGGPESGQPWWPIIVSVFIGGMIGSFFTLSLVPNKNRRIKK